jgi:hypothetical protein
MQNAGTRTRSVIIAILPGVIAALCSISHLEGRVSPYKAAVSGFAAFAATVLLAIADEQALGMLK